MVGASRGIHPHHEEDTIPLNEFSERADEFPFNDPTVGLVIAVVGAGGALCLRLHHAGAAPSSDWVEIAGQDKSLIEQLKQRVKEDGEERVAAAENANGVAGHPAPNRRTWPFRAIKSFGQGLLVILKNRWFEGITIAVISGLIVAYLVYQFHWAP